MYFRYAYNRPEKRLVVMDIDKKGVVSIIDVSKNKFLQELLKYVDPEIVRKLTIVSQYEIDIVTSTNIMYANEIAKILELDIDVSKEGALFMYKFIKKKRPGRKPGTQQIQTQKATDQSEQQESSEETQEKKVPARRRRRKRSIKK